MAQKTTYLLLTGLLIALLAGAAEYGGLLHSGDRLFKDVQFRTQQVDPEPHGIVMIAIDEASLAHFSKQGTHWPWPREFYAQIINYLDAQGARVIALDLLLESPDFDRGHVDGEQSDEALAEAMRRAGNVVTGFNSGDYHPDMPSFGLPEEMPEALPVEGCRQGAPQIISSMPVPRFLESARAIGNTHIRTSPDGLIRELPMVSHVQDHGTMPSLALAAYLMVRQGELNGDASTIQCDGGLMDIAGTEVPLLQNDHYLINWYGRGGEREGTFPYYSFQQVMQDAIGPMVNQDYEPAIDPQVFDDAIVFIGANAAGLGDIKNTPVSALADFPGMEIHATVLQNLLEESFITRPPDWASLAGLLLLTLGTVLAAGLTSLRNGSITAGALLAAVLLGSTFAFNAYNLWLPVTGMAGVVALGYTGAVGVNYWTEGREKRLVHNAFAHYVQPEVVHQLMEEPEKLKLGGEKKNITLLFSDLANFTSLSETMDPEELISLMNVYLDNLSQAILRHRGTIDKYIGDAVMAFWGAPIATGNHAEQACRAALDMVQLTPKIRSELNRDPGVELYTRFGINTGDMVVGNIGSEERFSYTVIGDAVNLAARLEPANKQFGTEILISEYTRSQLGERFLCRKLDLIVVKGKTRPVQIHELMGDLSEHPAYGAHENYADLIDQAFSSGFGNQTDDKARQLNRKIMIAETFHQGLACYYEQQWDRAIRYFEQVLEIDPGDGPSKTYIERCRLFQEQPPEPGWTGIFEMQSK